MCNSIFVALVELETVAYTALDYDCTPKGLLFFWPVHKWSFVIQDVVPNYPTTCEVEWVDAEDPLFLLYTSGSTGKPKVPTLVSLVKILFSFFFICCILT